MNYSYACMYYYQVFEFKQFPISVNSHNLLVSFSKLIHDLLSDYVITNVNINSTVVYQ